MKSRESKFVASVIGYVCVFMERHKKKIVTGIEAGKTGAIRLQMVPYTITSLTELVKSS